MVRFILNVADVFTCARGVPRRCLHSNTTRGHHTMPWVVFGGHSDAMRETCAAQDHQRDPADLVLPRTVYSSTPTRSRELPVDAERFAGIDVEIKDILTTPVTQLKSISLNFST